MKFIASLLTYKTSYILLIFLFTLPVMAVEANEQRTPLLNPFLEAEHLYHSGDIKKAQLFYQEYLSGKPSGDRSYIAMYRLGIIHQQNLSFATALRYYRMLRKRSPNLLLTHDVKFGQAQCLFELEKYIEAETLFKEIAYSHPDAKKKMEGQVTPWTVEPKTA